LDRFGGAVGPRASSVLAAVVSSDFVADALELRLRSGVRLVTEDGVRNLAELL
jgi:hypothetical protein